MKKETLASILKIGIAVLLIAALVFVVIYQNRNNEIRGRIDIFGGGGNDRSIEGYSVSQTAAFGDKVLLLTTNTYLMMDNKGRGDTVNVSFSDPRLSARGKYVAAYDDGGHDFSVYKNDSLAYEHRTESEIISASVNEQGYSAVACQDSGGTARITVYNDKGKAFYTWNLGSGQLVAMDLSADNTHLAVSSLNDSSEEMRGELSVISLDSEKKQASAVKKDEIYFDVRINRDYTVLALGSESLDYYNADGGLRWSLPFGGKTLRCADISNPDMAVLCYASVGSGFLSNSTQVEVISRLGEVTASTSFDGLCDSLSVNGSQFAASAGKKIFIYNKKCELSHELSSTAAVKRISLFKNGKSVFVLSGSGGSIINV